MGRRGDYDFGSQLGRGSFGVVSRVRRIKDGRTFVCKQIQLQSMNKKAREEASTEVTLLRRVSSGSDYIVQYIDSFLEGDVLHIIMEFCENGDLSHYLRGRGGSLVPERTVWKFLLQIGLGLQWLHQSRILHRDVKTLNVFLTSADDVRLGDLGVARVLSHNTQFANTFVGTPYYLSPELCEEKPYNEKSDVWAYGCVIYEMCTLRHPFDAKNHAALLVKILRGQYAPIHDAYSDDLRTLVDRCMKRDLHKRPTLLELFASNIVRSWANALSIALPETAQHGDGDEALSPPARQGAQQPEFQQPIGGRSPPSSGAANFGGSGGRLGLPPGRRAVADKNQRPPRARVRGSGVSGAAAAKSQVIAAPPSALAVAQAGRPSPAAARPGGGGVGRPGPQAPPSGGEGLGPPIRRPVGAGAAGLEERRRAAREVAELPDVVVPRQSRNAPSVHQLQQMETAASSSAGSDQEGDGASTSRGRGRPASACQSHLGSTVGETTLSPEEILQQAEATLLVAPAVAATETLCSDGVRADDGAEDIAPQLRLLRKISSEDAQLTHCSVFNATDVMGTQDSLMYTADVDSGDLDEDEGHYDAEVAEGGPGVEVIRWQVAAEDGDEVEQIDDFEVDGDAEELGANGEGEDDLEFSITATIDMNGLLCDELSTLSGPQPEAEPMETEHERAEHIQEATVVPNFAEAGVEAATLCPGEEVPVASCGAQEYSPLEAATPAPKQPVPGTGARDALERRIRNLERQIKRQYDSVAEALDAPARVVWDELYQLFQDKSKLSVELTDEDQSEIERYVFEQLPTESTDLVWKVYKVLALEQERDQCDKKLQKLQFPEGIMHA